MDTIVSDLDITASKFGREPSRNEGFDKNKDKILWKKIWNNKSNPRQEKALSRELSTISSQLKTTY